MVSTSGVLGVSAGVLGVSAGVLGVSAGVLLSYGSTVSTSSSSSSK